MGKKTNKKNAEPQKPPRHFLVHSTAVRPQVNEETKTLMTSLFFSLQALQHPESFGGENMQLVQPDLFLGFFCCFFAVDFLLFCSNLVFGSRVTGQETLKVTLLSTFYGEM